MSNGSLLGLDVVLVEVLLEVEVGQGLTLRRGQELLERSIRLDVVLVLEVLLLDVGRHRLGDVGARHLSALGLAEEVAEIVTELGGDLEDGEASRLGLTVRVHRRRATLTLASILDLAVHTLLELLELSVERGDDLAEAIEAGDHTLDLITNRLLRGLSGLRSGNSGHNRHRGNGCRSSGLSLGGSLASDLLGLSGRGSSNRGRSRGGNRGRGLSRILLRNTLGGGLGGGGSVHCTSSGGRIGRHFTHSTYAYLTGNPLNFLPPLS
jgi:hypothetical protein